jgi:ABC-type spermidine/putrescine transport system permease subunit II
MRMPALTPTTTGGAQIVGPGYALWRRRLPARLVETWLRTQTALLYLFLYAPIAVVVLFSFNDSRRVTIWGGFTTKWYQAAWTSPDVTGALQISLTVALLNAAVAVSLGTLAALGMRSAPRWLRTGFEGLVYMTIITPEIVIAIASVLYFVNLNIDLGVQTMVVTHAVYNTSIVALVVSARLAGMDRTLEEASADLGATPLGTFWQVTLPQLYPAVLAGALLAFTFSFDDFILSFFVSGVGSTTLPLNVFSRLRFGVSPIINAVAATMLSLTLTAIVVAQVVLRQGTQGNAGSARKWRSRWLEKWRNTNEAGSQKEVL